MVEAKDVSAHQALQVGGQPATVEGRRKGTCREVQREEQQAAAAMAAAAGERALLALDAFCCQAPACPSPAACLLRSMALQSRSISSAIGRRCPGGRGAGQAGPHTLPAARLCKSSWSPPPRPRTPPSRPRCTRPWCVGKKKQPHVGQMGVMTGESPAHAMPGWRRRHHVQSFKAGSGRHASANLQ